VIETADLLVSKMLAPESHTTTDNDVDFPDEEGHPPAVVRFYEAFRALYGPGPEAVPAEQEDNNKFLQTLPTANGSDLIAMITWQEVHDLIFPPHPSVNNGRCSPNCRQCDEWLVEVTEYDWTNILQPAPKHTPHLKTSTCSGEDNLKPEAISWPRPENQADTLEYRKLVCEKIAMLCNSILQHGRVPPGFLSCVTFPLRKHARPGQPTPNFADPDNTRGITCGNTLSKIFGLVILQRLSHWAEKHHLISPEQVAFQERRSSEMHVWTMQAILRNRIERGEETHVLFVDFKKAYDKVHRPLLWKILRKMGVPDQLVNILAQWHDESTTKVNVNGQLSDPIPMRSGVLQGAVLSPLLFNFFVEPLIRFIKEQINIAGIKVGNIGDTTNTILKILMFADDGTTMCATKAEAQLCFQIFDEWANDFGMQIGLGNGKTELMAFVPTHPPAQPAVYLGTSITVNDKTVSYVATYRYLGYHIRTDLTDENVIRKLQAKMRIYVNTLLRHNRVLRRVSNSTVIMLIKSIIIGGVLYLSCLLPTSEAQLRPLDTILRHALKAMLRVPSKGYPNSAVVAATGQYSMHDIVMKEHLRVYNTLCHPSNEDLVCAKVFKALLASNFPASQMPWVQSVSTIQQRMFNIDAEPPNLVTTAALTRQAALLQPYVVARQLSMHNFHEQTRAGVTAPRNHCFSAPRDGTATQNVSDTVARPLPTTSQIRKALHATLGGRKIAPIGTVGPGGMGALTVLARVPSKIATPLRYLVIGRGGLMQFPFKVTSVPMRMRNADGTYSFIEPGLRGTPGYTTAMARLHNPAASVVCGLCLGVDNPHHIVVQCSHATQVAIRTGRQRELGKVLNTQVQKLLGDREVQGCISQQHEHPILIEHLHIPDTFNWSGPIGQFLFWRHCMGLLWTHVNVPFFTTEWLVETPATTARTRQAAVGPYDNLPDMADVTPEEMNILKAFTALYSRLHVPSYKIRPLATAITKWASTTILQLANSRKHLCKIRWNGLLLGHNDLPDVVSATSSESDDSSNSSAPDTEESIDDTDSTSGSTNHSHYTTATDVTSASSSDVTHMSSNSDESDPDSDSDGDVALEDQAVVMHHANGAQHAIAIPIAAARIRRREPP
jgi:hypothetical protein